MPTLTDMLDKEIDLPRWAIEDYPEDAEDYAQWLRRGVRAALAEKYAGLTNGGSEKVYAAVEDWVLKRAKAGHSKTERAYMLLLYNANKEQWFHDLADEYETLRAYMASLVDHAESAAETSAWEFLANTAIPALKAAGVSVDKLWKVPLAASKARRIVPGLRALMQCPECETKRFEGEACIHNHPVELDEEQKEDAIQLIEMVADDQVSVDQIETHVAQMRGKKRSTLTQIQDPMEVCALPDGRYLCAIFVPGIEYVKAIQSALFGILSTGYSFKDILGLVGLLSNLVFDKPHGRKSL